MGVTWVSMGGLGEGRGMFRCQPGIPHPSLVRQHSAVSHEPGTQTHGYLPISSVMNSYFSQFHCFLFALVSHDS